MKIGDTVYIHGYVDEIRQDTVIIRNMGGYFGTHPLEIFKVGLVNCCDCEHYDTHDHRCKQWNHGVMANDYCSRGKCR